MLFEINIYIFKIMFFFKIICRKMVFNTRIRVQFQLSFALTQGFFYFAKYPEGLKLFLQFLLCSNPHRFGIPEKQNYFFSKVYFYLLYQILSRGVSNYSYCQLDWSMYYLPRKSLPILYNKLLYKLSQDFLDVQYCISKKSSQCL